MCNKCEEHVDEPQNVGSFMSNEEVANHMIADMDTEAKETWTEIGRNELIVGHHSTGRAIRNFYLMWHPENPYSGKDDDDKHPDARSMKVMELIWDKLNGQQAVS